MFILNKTILNILSNSIPHKTLTVEDNKPPYFFLKKSHPREKMFIKAIEIVKMIITYNT